MYKNPQYYWKFDEMCTTMKRFFTTLFFAVIACGFNTGAMGSISGCDYIGSYTASNVPSASSVGANTTYGSYLNCSRIEVYKASAYGMTFAIYDCNDCVDGYKVKPTDLTGFCNSGSTYGQCVEDIPEEPQAPGSCPLPSSIDGTTQSVFSGCSLDGMNQCCTGFTIKKTSTRITETQTSINGTNYFHVADFGLGHCETYDYYIMALSPCNFTPTPYWSIQSCVSCPDGRFPQEREVSAFGIDVCSFSYTDCAECLQDSDCPANDTNFVPDPYDSTRLKKSTYSCNIVNPTDVAYVNTCRVSSQYICADGFVPLDESIPTPTTNASYTCVECTQRSHCPADIDWVSEAYPARTQVYTAYSCENNSCVPSQSRRCKADYYGDGVTCDPCPPGTHSPDGATQRSQCKADDCTEASCQANGQHCDTSSGNCVECTTGLHCGTTETTDYGTNRQMVTKYSCTSNHTCSSSVEYQCKDGFYGNMSFPTIDSSLACYECTQHAHCTSDSKPVCRNYICAAGCVNNSHCTNSNKPICNETNNQCVQCLNANDCGADVGWETVGGGQEKHTTYACTNNSCDAPSTEWRCAANYYGDGTTCTQCPLEDGIRYSDGTSASIAGQSFADSRSITQCRLPLGDGTEYTDDSGTFTYSTDTYCYHQEQAAE